MKIIEEVNNQITKPLPLPDKVRSAFFPSEASVVTVNGDIIGTCAYATYLSFLNTPISNPIDARGQWTLDMGKMVEERYIEMLKRRGVWIGNNIKYYDPVSDISGEIDVLLVDRNVEPEIIIGAEVKSAYGSKFRTSIGKFPKLENLLQVALYLDYFKFPYWILVYHARDTQEQVEYRIQITEEKLIAPNGEEITRHHLLVDSIPLKLFYVEDIYARYRLIEEHVASRKFPPKDYTYGYTEEQTKERFNNGVISKWKMTKIKAGNLVDSDWQCLYCKYLNACWAEKREKLGLIEQTEEGDE